ncbi:MAG: hypothetical protein PHX30_04405 [Candidatus Pacebacteria bacterium]|jgi:hypothetical protein|nr:hypothetical protein [Candidatus Paceibacterota bacterium]
MSLNITVGRIREIVQEHEGEKEETEVVVWYTLRVGFLRKLAWFLKNQDDDFDLKLTLTLKEDFDICIFGERGFVNFEAEVWMNEEKPCKRV